MPFTVMLTPARPEAPPPQYQAAIHAAVLANGGVEGADGVVRLPDGGEFVVEARDFWPKRLSPGFCRIVFDAALRTNTYVDTAGSDLAPLKLKGTNLNAPRETGPSVRVANPAALCARLQGRLARWDLDMGRLRAEGLIGSDDQPLEPPPTLGAEQRLASDASGVATQCEAQARQLATRMGGRLVRGVVSESAEWGVVWRGDIAPDADPSTWIRETCWRKPHAGAAGGLRSSIRTLKMFDDSQSVEPLADQ